MKPARFAGALLLGVSSLAANAAWIQNAGAQTTPPPPPPPAADSQPVALKDIVITARHRTERAQSVPISLTTVSPRQIRTVGSSNLNKLQQLVPSLTVESFNPRNTSLNIRGLGAVPNLANDGLEGGVGVYVDGVLLARPAQTVFDFPDLQDIEVLRGPQGTLFGKNTVAGAININTRLPSFTPEADGSISFGSQNYAQFKASASSALFGSDKLAFRLSVQGTQHDGYISNLNSDQTYGNQNDKGIRAQLLANVTPDLTIRTILDYSTQSANCCVNLPVGLVTNYAPGYNNGAAIPSVLTRYANLGYTLPAIDPFGRKTDVDSPVFYHMETGGASVQADYNLHGYTITSISAVRYWNWYPHNDTDDTALPIYTAASVTDYQRQVSQELRLTSPVGGVVDYTGGLYYFYQSIDDQNYGSFGSAAGAFLAGTVPSSATAQLYNTALNGFAAVSNGVYITHSLAAYGQATWHVTPKFDITTGLRYTYEIKDGYFTGTQQGGAAISSLPAAARSTVTAIRNSFGAVTAYNVSTNNGMPAGLITFSYKPDPNILTYTTYSHGAKSAGINLVGTSYVPKTVAPETIDNFELGAKTTLLEGRLLLNGDLFWAEDKNYQSTLVGTTPGGTVFTYIASVPKVRSRGVEIDSQAQVTSGLSLFFSGIYNNAYNESNPAAPCPIELGGSSHTCNLTGRPVAGVSPWTASVGGEFDQPLRPIHGHDVVAYFDANAIFKTGFYSSADDSAYGHVPGYGLGNIAFGVKAANGAWDLSGWVRNVTNTHYYLFKSATGQFPTYNLIAGQVGDPITGGVTLSGKF